MSVLRRTTSWLPAGAAALLFATFALGGGPKESAPGGPPKAEERVTVPEARERAKLMHQIYAATLDALHHRFFRRDQSVLPARAMEDIFTDMEKQADIKAGWIAVNTKAMSLDHEPKDDFEKAAARALAAGKGDFEVVEKGVYRRAGPIPLGSGCASCHSGVFGKTPQSGRLAGLVISIPVREK